MGKNGETSSGIRSWLGGEGKPMPHLKLLLLLSVILIPCQSLIGQEGRDRGAEVWQLEEYGRNEGSFSSYDLDGNGTLSRDEIQQWARSRADRGGQRGGDGRRNRRGGRNLGRGTVRIVLALADSDGDGSVLREEWDETMKKMAAAGDSIEVGDLQKKLAAAGAGRFGEMMALRLDGDGDGRIALTRIEPMFERADGDRDGKVDGESSAAGGRNFGGGRTSPGGGGEPRRGRAGAPPVGEVAPDFELPLSDRMETTVRLSSFSGEKPVALIFGSYT